VRIAAGFLVGVALLAGCSSGDDDDTTAAPPGTEAHESRIEEASATRCATEVATLQTAVEAYKAMNSGAIPATEAELVTAQVLVREAEYADLDAAGTAVPAPVCSE